MTKAELSRMKGEIIGLKILLINILSDTVIGKPDLSAYLKTLEERSVAGILILKDDTTPPQHMPELRNAAAGLVAQAIEAVRETHSRVARPPTLQ